MTTRTSLKMASDAAPANRAPKPPLRRAVTAVALADRFAFVIALS
jgi:hypothetical protein